MGRLEEADRAFDRAREMASGWRDTEVLCSLHYYSEFLCEMRGDAGRALHARDGLELAQALGSAGLRAGGFATLGRAHLMARQEGDAIQGLEAGIEIMRTRHTVLNHEALNLGLLAEAYAAAGDVERARIVATDAVRLARERREIIGEITALLARVRVSLAADDRTAADQIQTDLRDLTALVERIGARAYLPFIHVERARLTRLLGDDVARGRELDEARRLFTEMGATARAEQVAKDLAS